MIPYRHEWKHELSFHDYLILRQRLRAVMEPDPHAVDGKYLIGSVVIGLILLVFANRKAHVNPYIVVLSCDDKAAEDRALALLKEKTTKCVCKSKTARAGQVELNLEVRLPNDNTDFVNELSALEGVQSAVLVSYNGEYMG